MARYMATSCGRVGRGGNASFPTFRLDGYGPMDGRTDGPMDGQTDRRTDGRTDKASYRVACPQLKKKENRKERKKERQTERNVLLS